MAPRSGRVNPTVQSRGAARSFVESLDTYYQPARDTRREKALQQGLGQFSAMFQEQAAEVQDERRKGYFQQGQLDALAEQAGEEIGKVRTGGLFRQNSKFYEMGLNEGRGSAAAIKWKNDMRVEFEQSGIDAQKNPEAFRQWMDGRINDFLGQFEGNQYAIDGAMPHISETVNNLSMSYSTKLNDRLHQERIDIYSTELADIMDGDFRGDYDRGTTIDALMNKTEELFGTEGPAANDALVSTAITYALTNSDPEAILMIAEGVDAGKFKLNVEQKYRLKQAMDSLEADLRSEEGQRSAQQKALQEARTDEILQDYSEQWVNDPTVKMPAYADIVEMGGDYTTYTRLKSMKDTYASNKSPAVQIANAGSIFELEDSLAAATSKAEAQKVIQRWVGNNPGILSDEQLASRYRQITETFKAGGALADPVVNEFRDDYLDSLGALVNNDYTREKVDHIVSGARLSFNKYMVENYQDMVSRGLGPMEMFKEARDHANSVVREAFDDIGSKVQNKPDQAGMIGMNPQSTPTEPKDDPYGDGGAAGGAPTDAPADAPTDAPAGTDEPDRAQAPEGFTPTRVSSMAGVRADAEELQGFIAKAQNAPEGPPLEEQPAPFEDPDTPNEPYDKTRQTFYSELLNAFTDGEFTVAQGHTSMKAREVMEADPEFASEVNRLAEKYQVSPAALLAVMQFESGFSPSIRNAVGSGATGLIQFMPSTARSLGITTDELARMPRAQQMKYVEKYFDQFQSRIMGGSVEDLYMAVLWPKAVGQGSGYVLFAAGTKAYDQNSPLDRNGDGTVTKFEAAASVRAIFERQ